MSKSKRRLSATGTPVILIMLALQTIVGVVFGDTTAPAAAPAYTFITIDIPTLNEQLGFTHLADINEKGEITGGFTNSILGPYGFFLDKKVRSTEIRCSKDVVVTEPQSINKHGEIAGFASVIIDRIKIPEPPFEILVTKISGFFRDKKGRCTILDFPGANLTEAVGVNDDGQVVGDYQDSDGKFHGFFWNAGLFLTIDLPFPEATLTAPTGINNVGQMVGFYFDNNATESFPNGHAHGFLYDNGTFTSFDFPDATATLPADINDHGQVVGIYGDTDFVAHSFVLDDGAFKDFDVSLPGVIATQVSGINNRGQIVGRYLESNPSDPVNPSFSHGFIATPGPKLVANLSTAKGDKK
jgi:probable HAF family extracellular repeat protein